MSDDPMVGRVIQGRYEVSGILGEGGMGAVYRAEQTAMGRQVALKMLRSEFGQDEQLSERFVREARNSARLEHPNTVRVFDFGKTEEGDLFLVMELLSGGELADVIGNGMSPSQAIHICRQIARSVAEAHNKGLVHRDLKPANVNVSSVEGDDCFVKVLDFGLAKLTQSEDGGEKDQSLTSAGAALGTPLYMSPEQCAGVKVDSRCDIYALGCILYELLTGRPPFVGASVVMTMTMHIRDEVPPLTDARPDRVFPPSLETIIRKCMEKDVADRFQKMEDIVVALEAAQQAISGGGGGAFAPMPTPNFDGAATDMTVAPGSGVDLANAVSAQLTNPMGNQGPMATSGVPGMAASHPGAGSVPNLAPAGAAQSHVAGELAVRSGLQEAVPSQGGAGKMLVAAVVLVALGGGGFFLMKQGTGGEAPPAESSSPEVAAPTPAPDPAPAPAPVEGTVFVAVKGDPAGATVKFDGADVGSLPALEKFPKGADRIKLEVVRKGYESFAKVVSRAEAKEGTLEIQVNLTKKKKKKKRPTGKSDYGAFDEDDEAKYEDF